MMSTATSKRSPTRPAPGDDRRRGAQTVHRAIDILEAFSIDRPSLSLADISSAVKLTVPTTHRLLKALRSKNMVGWDASSRRYSLGAGVMNLASVIIQRDDIVSISQPGLERLRTKTGETVGIHWLVGEHRVCLVELTSPHQIRMASGVGRSYPLYAGASGKAILAWLPLERVSRVIEEAIESKALSGAQARVVTTQLDEIRKRGFATSVGETVPGAAAIAAPILNSSHVVIGSINITGPANRFNEERRKQAIKPLIDVAAQVMSQLGRPTPIRSGYARAITS
jgi:IclR family transcriptional regulator, KDG regulon repressor